jgi:hypothetical protein
MFPRKAAKTPLGMMQIGVHEAGVQLGLGLMKMNPSLAEKKGHRPWSIPRGH